MPVHILGARGGGLDRADITAIVEGGAVIEPRLRVIRELTQALVETKDKPSGAAFEGFKARGVTAQQIIGFKRMQYMFPGNCADGPTRPRPSQ